MSDPVYGFDKRDIERIARAVRDFEQSEGKYPRTTDHNRDRRFRAARLGIAQESISPNTSGTFQFAYGTKGSETADGNDLEGYYRTASDSGDIATDAVCYVFWINDGWELTPVECP